MGAETKGGKKEREKRTLRFLIPSKPTVEPHWGGSDSLLGKGAESKVARRLSTLRLSNKLYYLKQRDDSSEKVPQ